MNVLHINSNYLTSRLHENLMDQIETKEIHNTVFMPIKKEKKSEFLYQSKHEIYSPVSFKDKDKYIFTLKQYKIFKKIESTLKIEQYGLIHAHTLFTDGNVAYNLNKKYGIPYIVTVRGYTDINVFFKTRLNLRRKGRKILNNASSIIFLSEANKNELLDNYIEDEKLKYNIESKCIVSPNGIDDFWFTNVGKPKIIKNKKDIKFIYVGKIMKLKNVLGTIEALKYFNENSNYQGSLTIVGKKVDKAYTDKILKESEVRINVLDQMPREKLINLYRESDIFIMPSFKETFGLVYPEAMSQGLPVIYTKGQGFDQQFEEGMVGYSVDANDPSDISESMIKIVERYKNTSQNAINNFTRFNWNDISKRYIKIYKKILNIGE